jgi:hypothetical protein
MCFIDLIFKICCVRGVDDQSELLRHTREHNTSNNSAQLDKEIGEVFHQDLYRGIIAASNVGVNLSKQRMERIQKQSNCDITQSIEPSALTSSKQRGNHLDQTRLRQPSQISNEECINDSSPLILR